MALDNITLKAVDFYNSILSSLPGPFQTFINLFLLVLLIVVYSIFIWKFYRFIAKKNLFGFKLSKYNNAKHPFLIKLLATALYMLEYILIIPFIIFVWFAIFTLFLIVLTETLTIREILILAVTIIAAIRMTAYIPKYGEELSKEIAKMLPFMLLAVSLLNPGFFSFERVIGHLSDIPNYLNLIINYLLFIAVLEIILRFFDFLFGVMGLDEDEEQAENEENVNPS